MSQNGARCNSSVKLLGKTALVTGCNTGIGKETVLDFYKRGARVIMVCRNLEKANEAKLDIEKKCKDMPETGTLVIIQCDLSCLKSVRECARKILDSEPQLNILVNNAGIMMCPEGKTVDGYEIQFATNHLAHFFLTLLLLPRIRNSKPARIVTVSSNAHTRHGFDLNDLNFERRTYNEAEAYAQSKLANVLFSKELAAKLKEYNIDGVNTYSLHPGIVDTQLLKYFYQSGKTFPKQFMLTPELGAQTTVYCSVDEKCACETGLYYSECAVAYTFPAAIDNDAKKLWDISLKLVGMKNNPFAVEDPGVKA